MRHNQQLDLFDAYNRNATIIQSSVFPDTESDELEFKSAAGGFPNEFWKTYSAFATAFTYSPHNLLYYFLTFAAF